MENNNTNDHLKAFIQNNEMKEDQEIQQIDSNIISQQNFGPNTRTKVQEIKANSNYISIELHELPFGKFYSPATRIQVRALETVEIESFAIINEKNAYDVKLKLNEVLRACVNIEIDGKLGSSRDLMDGDRDTISIVLSRMSKKHGNKLEKKVLEQSTGKEVSIELIPANYVFKEEDPKLTKWWNPIERVYHFKLKNGAEVKLAPPTLGLASDIDNYILAKALKSGGKDPVNVTFMECIPYMLAGKGIKSITTEKLEQEEYNFGKLNQDLFQFIFDAVSLIKFGVEEIRTISPYSGQEVRTSFSFPSGARDLFIIRNAFDEFIG